MIKKVLATLVAAALLGGCGKEEVNTAAPAVADSNIVEPAESLVAQLKIEAAGLRPIAETLRVAGQISFDENRLARIGATITGRVMDIEVNVGTAVDKGSVLATINSSELSTQQLAYLKARSQLELSKRNAERAKSLFEADVISAAELQRRQAEYQIAIAEENAASDQLKLLGVSAAAITRLGEKGAINSVTPVASTLRGIVVERNLNQGQVVQPADVLFVVADLGRLWAVAQVPEQQVSQVKAGQSVSIEIPALGNEKRVGKLIYVGQTVNPETRTVLVRTELDNADGQLKPAMLATMLIEAKPVDRLVVPEKAVVRENDADHVFVVGDDGRYRLRPVKLGIEQDDYRVVLSGLKPGEKLVVDGAFHLNNERNRQALEGGA
ncbi:MAG: efflux RND transporter periplasmic adaptor subunit [Azonexaceae bacterium]|uniref:efflux RND transporter periplasmic adaptor subunit n=1 Tax=Azonexus sp. R2A61 TaxID=2744443 RepID=UPI001F41F29C|nr:efflux RND transporter periplasmic adaptor subunit [Azonexus sp. R2A61]MCE1239564.1 efflux RND transporter periplasmic adaptor subunit [Azonexaceae bacterium]